MEQQIQSNLSDQERMIWAALAADIRFGARHFAQLIATGKNPIELWHASINGLKASGLDQKFIDLFEEIRAKINPKRVIDDLQSRAIRLITIYDSEYPNLLKEISVPPAVLYIKGQFKPELLLIAVVGSRKASVYGRQATEDIVGQLVANGVSIVSGLALGIDGYAHQATLSSGGITYAILAGGLDSIYPSSHTNLAKQIIESGGALISEFPPGTRALKHHFPIRNRIIAGMTKATVIVEAAIKSGSLLTAREALDANRDVFAIPGSIYASTSVGPHRLIQMGAKLVCDVDDILLELNIQKLKTIEENKKYLPASVEEKTILELLDHQQLVDLDQLVETTQFNFAKISSLLTLMEMKGLVRNTGNNNFIKI